MHRGVDCQNERRAKEQKEHVFDKVYVLDARCGNERHFQGALIGIKIQAEKEREGDERYVRRRFPRKGKTDREHRRGERGEKT